ncbi:MAG TPA: hypothetical protein DCE55_11040 [Planctomycetaceae bacterium]|nr:hypothetical protein [Planctomycetaceae bacterium]
MYRGPWLVDTQVSLATAPGNEAGDGIPLIVTICQTWRTTTFAAVVSGLRIQQFGGADTCFRAL